MTTMMLAEQGAEVIKVEPEREDIARVGPFTRQGLGSLFLNVNRGKRAICLNIAKPRGREPHSTPAAFCC